MSIIFITHKLNEVLEIADRISVLRRGKKIDTVPREGATEAEPRAADGRPRGGVPGREAAAERRARRCSRSSDLHVIDDRGIEKVRGVSFEVQGGGDRRHRRRRQQRPDRADRRPHRASATRRPGTIIGRRQGRTHGDAAHDDRRGRASGTSRRTGTLRGLVLDFCLAENLALHDYRHEPDSQPRLALPAPPADPRGPRCCRSSTCAAAAPRRRRRALSGGNQQKVVLAREIDRDPTRPDRRAADARPRRRRDRVRPPAADRRARRGPRRAARLARARGDLLALRPDPRHVRGRRSSASTRPTSPRTRSASP